jgi:predicted AAA+ superfamily ATPase
MVKLLPLTIGESSSFAPLNDPDTAMLEGFYPGRLLQNIPPHFFYGNYFETYIERDMRQLSHIDNLSVFDKFVRLLATRTGSLLNHNSLANDCGLSQPTMKRWLSLLEAGYIVFLLPPFFRNIGKRFIKTPKVYFYDTGLLCFLLGIENRSHLATHPLRGSIFENMVVMELLKNRFNSGKRSNLYFFRDHNGNEVDVVMEQGAALVPFEIKSSSTKNVDFVKTLLFFKELFPKETQGGSVVYDGDSGATLHGFDFLNWKDLRGING